jgi:hypothetical protein
MVLSALIVFLAGTLFFLAGGDLVVDVVLLIAEDHFSFAAVFAARVDLRDALASAEALFFSSSVFLASFFWIRS